MAKNAYELTRKDGAVGVDGQTAAEYASNLHANLKSLLDRIKSCQYKAQPARRVCVPKADGSKRPLGISAFEEKVAQRAIVLLLEPIYEQEFKDCSFGFRPEKSPHQALQQLRTDIMERDGRWACPEGHISKSVKVRPRLKGSRPRSLGGIMARKQDGEALRQHL